MSESNETTPSPSNEANLRHRFTYHAPDDLRAITHTSIREALLSTALYLDQKLPEGREKSLVLTKLEEAMFWANAAVARNPKAAAARSSA